jgi:hypothetical protein
VRKEQTVSEPSTLTTALTTLLTELVDGCPGPECYVLNPQDRGLLHSLSELSAARASVIPQGGGASIAAHVDHLRYGFELLNRYASGDDEAFAAADYSRSWQRVTVSDPEWQQLREQLADELNRWRRAMPRLDARVQLHVTGAMSSIVHLAYHLGAIRQIDRALAGPQATSGA